MQFQSVKETAEKFNISERRVQKLCEMGRINGAQMISNVWIIPEDAEKPTDERITSISIDDNLISLSELCKELSISVATGRNWVKLGKLIPTSEVKRTPYFTTEYVKELKSSIQSGDNAALKSRRNKKYVSGNNIYNSYVSDNSVNIPIIQNVLDSISLTGLDVSDDVVCALVSECAIQLIRKKHFNTNTASNSLRDFIAGNLPLNGYEFLIDDVFNNSQSILAIVENNPELFSTEYVYEQNEDVLGLLYISLKNLGSRKATGSYYTPTKVVKKLCDRLFEVNAVERKDILDPCCGTGNFLLQLPQRISFDNVYGNDIDKISVQITRINMALKYNVMDKKLLYSHITELDYLGSSFTEKYDFIIGNPPWGYDYSEIEKEQLRRKYSSAVGSSIESYDIFIEQAISNLSVNGVLSFVLPEAVLNVKTHTPIRKMLMQTNSFQYLEFLGNAFDKVQCPCIILQTVHNNKHFSTEGLMVNDGNRSYTLSSNRDVTADFFSFLTNDEEYSILEKILSVPNKVTLKGNATFALGIVTGNNKEYISNRKTEENEMVLKGSDLCKFRFNEPDNYIVFKPESFQQIAPTEYYRASEKLLYRFICSQLVFAYDNQQTLSLNSCNILIPAIDGLDFKYIMAVLNSRIAQYFFKKQFNSVKVLRSHIEQIPIPAVDNGLQSRFVEIVDNIMTLSEKDETTICKLYDELDSMISKLFSLTEDEYAVIKNSVDVDNKFLV